MIRKYEGLNKVANKRLALVGLAATMALLSGCGGHTSEVEVTPTPVPTATVQPTKPVPTVSPIVEGFKLEDATVESFAKDLETIQAETLSNGFSVRQEDVISYLTYQNIFNIKDADMQDIIDTYFEGEFDIDEISANADGYASQVITQNLLNPVGKHMSMNYNHDELDYLMYQQVEKEYLTVRTMFENKEIDLDTRNQKFIEWLTALEKFYNEDGSITLENDNQFDGVYFRATMSDGAEATIQYLGIEMSQWVTNVKNDIISSQLDVIVNREGENVGKIQHALNDITNSSNPAQKLEEYLTSDYLTQEEMEDLKVLLQLYSIGGLADSIFNQCDFSDVQPAIISKGQDCTNNKTR